MPSCRESGNVIFLEKLHRNFVWCVSVGVDYVEPILVQEGILCCLEQDLGAVWRPARIVTEQCYPSLPSGTTKSWHNEQPSVAIFRAERDVFPIRRPIWRPLIPWSLGDLNGIAAADLLYPDVKFAAAIGTVSDEAPIRRPRRSDLQAIVKCETCQSSLPWRGGSMPPLVEKKCSTGQQRQCA